VYPRDREPMSNWDDDRFSDDDRRRTKTDTFRNGSTGSQERVTRYPDGSSTRHGGGPAGDTRYNDQGEEC